MIDRADYDAAYPAVADGVTLYVWREPAFRVAQWTARAGLPAIATTTAAAVMSAVTFVLFWTANYWPGLLAGFVFGVVATAAVHVVRAPGSSKAMLQALVLLSPPVWWWAWEHGLAAYGRPLTPLLATIVLWTIVGGYAGQRIIELVAVRRFGVAIDRWHPFDSRFRLVAADRDIDLAILLIAMVLGRPRFGLEAVGWWTLISLIVAAVRFAQMNDHKARGRAIASWLDG
ncbi:MAG: hypothetical protein V4502_00595 [Pseudomonadota bacterium]